MRDAVVEHDVNVIGLMLSENQLKHDEQNFAEMDSPAAKKCGCRDASNSTSRSTGLRTGKTHPGRHP
jgi:cyclopropane fatty-acyl-phospholipid synthase-like methyltransferase